MQWRDIFVEQLYCGVGWLWVNQSLCFLPR
jgi:hypothetical protein